MIIAKQIFYSKLCMKTEENRYDDQIEICEITFIREQKACYFL